MRATQPTILTQTLSWVWRTSRPWFIWIIAILLFLCTGTAAHSPEAEFADWFRSLKEPGTEGMMDGSTARTRKSELNQGFQVPTKLLTWLVTAPKLPASIEKCARKNGDGMAPQAAAEKAFKRVEEIFAKYTIDQG